MTRARLEISVTRHPFNGSLTLCAIVDGHLVQRTYYFYSVREARSLFRAEVCK